MPSWITLLLELFKIGAVGANQEETEETVVTETTSNAPVTAPTPDQSVAAEEEENTEEAPSAPPPAAGDQTGNGPCPVTGDPVCSCDDKDDEANEEVANGPCPVTGDAVCHCSDKDEEDHHAAHGHDDITPPGPGADDAAIAAFIEALGDQEETHVHDDASPLAAEHMAAMDLVPRSDATHVAIGDGDWFDPAIWSTGTVPGDTSQVLIPEGVTVRYAQVSETELFTVRVDGKLEFSTESDSQMLFDTMVVSPSGHLEIGTVDDPVAPDVTVDLVVINNGPIDTDWDPMLLSRGLISHGKAEIHGAEKDSHEKAIEDPMAGDTSLSFADVPTGWQVGDTIVIAGTHYDGYKWDNDIRAVRHHESEDEVRVISSIEGNSVHFDEPLVFDHDAPQEGLKTSVANYTRNVSIETEDPESADVSERGHVMFMHSDDVDVRYAEFHELGRTDKSEDSFSINDIDDVQSDSNVQGRYSFHLHRTGTDNLDDPTIAIGNAVYGAPGWGFVHHDSNALMENNASFDTFGAGFVAESGNETGAWNDNIAIYAQGVSWADPKNAVSIRDGQFDTGRTGDGFWFQGRMVESNDNIAASVNTGFVYFHRGSNGEIDGIDAENFALPDALNDTSVKTNEIPILHFDGNESFAAKEGLHIVKANPNQGHDVWSVLNDFTAWNVRSGAHLEYTSHYLLNDFHFVGKDDVRFSNAQNGIDFGPNTTDIVIRDAKIEGFDVGIDLDSRFTPNSSGVEGEHFFTVIDPNISDVNEDIANFDPNNDVITTARDLERAPPDLQLDEPVIYREWQGHGDSGFRTATFSGTKSDSLGDVPFPAGTDTFRLEYNKMIDILEEDGYWTTSDGSSYVLADVYLTDRASGEVYYETHPIYFADNVNLGAGLYEKAQNNGTQDIETVDGKTYAGDVLLDTAIPVGEDPLIYVPRYQGADENDAQDAALPAVEPTQEVLQYNQESSAELWALLTKDQGAYDETLPSPEDFGDAAEEEMV
ncbi:MAG: G8 domain-containing protein [Pseudomonadota bacterium]